MNLLHLYGQQEDADMDSLFQAANVLYQQGQYEPALEGYNTLIMSGK
jgi:hypothetical protein